MNPLQKTWMVVSTIFGAIGLVNVTEDIHKWAPFFEHLMDHYQAIWYWPFRWIPFRVADWVKDYIFLGMLIFSSAMKANYKTDDEHSALVIMISVIIVGSIAILIWPLLLIFLLLRIYLPQDRRKRLPILKLFEKSAKNEQDINESKRIIQTVGSAVLLFFVFLVVSIIIQG